MEGPSSSLFSTGTRKTDSRPHELIVLSFFQKHTVDKKQIRNVSSLPTKCNPDRAGLCLLAS